MDAELTAAASEERATAAVNRVEQQLRAKARTESEAEVRVAREWSLVVRRSSVALDPNERFLYGNGPPYDL